MLRSFHFSVTGGSFQGTLVVFGALLAAAGLPALVHLVLAFRERRRFPAPGVLVDIPGASIHFLVKGEGRPTVILDSALASTSLSWSQVQPAVARFTRVASYDRAGFGWSGPSSSPRRVDSLVDELRRALEALALEPPYVLVGHSYGGFAAKLYAARHPSEVAGMVLVDVPHPGKWASPDAAELERIARGARLARAAAFLARFGILRLLLRLAPRRWLGSLSTLLSKLSERDRAIVRMFWLRPWTLHALASLIEEAPRSAVLVESAAGDLGDRPLAVVTAAGPSPEREREQEGEARRSRRSRHLVAEWSGHWVPLEEPELVVEAIRGVVEAARRGKPS
jgi:pimeloyl-ACP methyl ester carboxylesterase